MDRYTKRDVALLLTVFLLNVGDAFFTMSWLSRGGKEANPVMDFFLDIGPGAFLAQKCLVVGIWLLVLVVHKNFRFARTGLYATLLVYAALMLVHFSIIFFDVEPPSKGDVERAKMIVPKMQSAASTALPQTPSPTSMQLMTELDRVAARRAAPRASE